MTAYAISASAVLVASAAFIEHYRIQVTHTAIASDRLPPQFDGFTILHLSDLHTMKYGRLERKIAGLLSQFQPDLLVATGDLAAESPGVEPFCRLMSEAPAKEGRLVVFGNAEHILPHMGRKARELIPAHGIGLLDNEHVRITRGGDSIVVAGVDDPFTRHADLSNALAGVGQDEFTVLLAHAPNIAAEAIEAGVDVVLSGHTHGGQLKLPFLPAPYPHTGRGPRLEAGLYEGELLSRKTRRNAGRTRIYVSRGLGTSYIPARLFCRPELPVVTLRREVG